MSKRKHSSPVQITWEDSSGYSSGAWQPQKQTLKPSIIRSVGYIHAKSKRSIELAPHISPQNTMGNICIPRSAIRRIRNLRAK